MSYNPQLNNPYGQPVYINQTGAQPNPLNQPAYGQPFPQPPPFYGQPYSQPPPSNGQPYYPQPPPTYGPVASNSSTSGHVVIIQPPSPAPAAQKTERELRCLICGRGTPTIPVRKSGGVTWLWCCCLCWFTGICCFLPFLIDSCKDLHLVCMQCNTTKQIIPANCC